MSETQQTDTGRRRGDMVMLAVFVIACLGVGAAGGYATATSVETWYQTLQKPSFNPPDWLFGPVWTVLYVMMGIAAWSVWRTRHEKGGVALVVFSIQLALNFAWSFLFFWFQRIDLALVEIVVLLVAVIATTILFWRISRTAGLLLVPYVLWVSFAALLNFSLWHLNT